MKIKKEFIINIIISIVIIALLTIIDQITKNIIVSKLNENDGYITVIPNFIGITHHRNTGMAFGMLQGKKVFLIIVTFVALFVFGYLMRKIDFRKYPFYSVSLVLMIGGLFGNFYDRLFRPLGVVDFVKTLFVDFAIFNFADMCLTCGAILMGIDIIFGLSGELWKS